jgi:hypothetical protein
MLKAAAQKPQALAAKAPAQVRAAVQSQSVSNMYVFFFNVFS